MLKQIPVQVSQPLAKGKQIPVRPSQPLAKGKQISVQPSQPLVKGKQIPVQPSQPLAKGKQIPVRPPQPLGEANRYLFGWQDTFFILIFVRISPVSHGTDETVCALGYPFFCIIT